MSTSKLLLCTIAILFNFGTCSPLNGQASSGALYVGSASGMYAHIADAEAAIGVGKTGTVILSSGFTDVITSTLYIGWPTGPGLKVLMMPGSTIQENVTSGSPGIVILEGSALECLGAGPSGSVNGQLSPCQVTVGNSGVKMSAMVASGFSTTGRNQDMFDLQGITFRPGLATIMAVGDFEAIVAPSLIANNNFFGGPNVTYEWHIGNGVGGGETMFLNNELRGDSAVTGAMVYITGGENGYINETGNFGIVGGEVSCSGPNAPTFLIDGDPAGRGTQGVVGVKIHGVWSQACPGGDPQSSSYVSINNASYIHIYDQNLSGGSASFISISESAPGLANFIVFDNIGLDCANPNCTGQTFITDTTASGFTHPAPSWTNNLPQYGYQGFVQHDQAGGGWSHIVGSSGGSGTGQQTDTILNVMQSGTAGSASYADASAGYAWRVQNDGAINVDFGANDYADGWIESYQNGTTTGKPLNINSKYGGYVNFGGDIFGPNFTFTNGHVQSGTAGSASYKDASAGYAWRVQNQGAINVDFGANDYADGWIESYQNGTTVGKPLNINSKYGGYTNFGGFVYAPRYSLTNGDGVTAMPQTSAVANHVTCTLSVGPPIRLGQCASSIRSDGSCNCR